MDGVVTEEVTTKTVLAQEVSVRQHEVEEAARNLRELRTLLETQKFNHKQDKMEWERKLFSLTMENESLHVKLQVTEQEVHRLLVRTCPLPLKLQLKAMPTSAHTDAQLARTDVDQQASRADRDSEHGDR
jgi:vancomycin resistance protein YoaR